MFLGAAGGIALSHVPGPALVPAVGMGIGAMTVVMLRLPLTSVLLDTLLLPSDGLAIMPLVIVAVVVAFLASARLSPAPAGEPPGRQAGMAGVVGRRGGRDARCASRSTTSWGCRPARLFVPAQRSLYAFAI
jgi:hypothetical protein